MADAHEDAIRALPCWRGRIDIAPAPGGMTNHNFCVTDAAGRAFVRLGADIPEHGVMRFNELAATRAAAACGLSPALRHAQPGVIVLDWLEARPLTVAQAQEPAMLARLGGLMRKCHREVAPHLRGPVLAFPVFHVLRDYAATLRAGDSRHAARLEELGARADALERVAGPSEILLCHNDLLFANILDDGARLWLIDWDYAGFGNPMFDVATIASNCRLDAAGEGLLLEASGFKGDAATRARLHAMACASLLREMMWTMVSEVHRRVDVDFAAYMTDVEPRFEEAWQAFEGAQSKGAQA